MYKEVGLVLAGALCFDLGVVVVPAKAADEKSVAFLKIDSFSPSQDYIKITMEDVLVTSMKCTSNKGTLVEFKGTKYCQTPKQPGSLPASTQKK